MSITLQEYQKQVSIARTMIEESLLCSDKGARTITLGGEKGPKIIRQDAEILLERLKKHQIFQQIQEVEDDLRKESLPAIICSRSSFWFGFQQTVYEIEMESHLSMGI